MTRKRKTQKSRKNTYLPTYQYGTSNINQTSPSSYDSLMQGTTGAISTLGPVGAGVGLGLSAYTNIADAWEQQSSKENLGYNPRTGEYLDRDAALKHERRKRLFRPIKSGIETFQDPDASYWDKVKAFAPGAVGALIDRGGAERIVSQAEERQAEEIAQQRSNFFRTQRLNQLGMSPQMQFKSGGYIPTYPNGGKLRAEDFVSRRRIPKYEETNVHLQYTDPTTGKAFYAVKPTERNIANPNVFLLNKDTNTYATELPYLEGSNKWDIDYLPATRRRYADQSEQLFKPAGFQSYRYGGKMSNLPQGKATMKDVKMYQSKYPEEMVMGRQVEYEHTKNKHLADRIAADHIKDFEKMTGGAGYYQGLKDSGLTDELKCGGMMKYSKGGGLSRSKDYGSKKKPYPSVKLSDFAGGDRSYPIPTKADAVDALRLAGLHGRSDVKSKVYKKYPGLKKKAAGGPMEETRYNPDITYFATGGLHNENPNGGINIGNKGLVEQGEVKYGNFIFSNRF